MDLRRITATAMERLMGVGFTPGCIILVPLIIGCARTALEHLMFPAMGTRLMAFGSANFLAVHTFYSVLFYQLTLLCMVGALALVTWRPPAQLVGPVCMGLLLGWLPPLLDALLPRQLERWYGFFSEFHWDLAAPTQLLGEIITLWVTVAASGLLALWLSRRVWRGLAGAVAAYGVLQFTVWGWPRLTTYLDALATGGVIQPTPTEQGVTFLDLSGILFIFIIYSLSNWTTLWPSWRRLNHALPFGLIAAIVARMSSLPWSEAVWRGSTMAFAFLLIIVANDHFDQEQDSCAGGSARPATAHDLALATFLQVCLVFAILLFHPNSVYAILLFFALFAAYHWPGMRLKRFLGVAYSLEGLAVGAVILLGHHGGHGAKWVPLGLAIMIPGFALGCMFKDYKDVDQDRAAGVNTIYTQALAWGVSVARVHIVVRVILGVLLLVPVIWLLVLKFSPAWSALLAVLAVLPSLFLGLQNRKHAVEAAIWAVSVHLTALLLLLPMP